MAEKNNNFHNSCRLGRNKSQKKLHNKRDLHTLHTHIIIIILLFDKLMLMFLYIISTDIIHINF